MEKQKEMPEFIKKQYLEFRKLYRNWFKELSDGFPDSKKTIIKYYKDHMENSHEDIMNLFLVNVKPYLEKISDLDYTFFDDCVEFYKDIEYSNLVKLKEESFRKSQMVYLTKLSYMTIMLSDVDNKDNMDDFSPLLIKLLANIQTFGTTAEGINIENMMKNLGEALNPENMAEGDRKFISENPLLADLAEEISKEVVIPESFKNIQNPQDIFKIIFDKEGKQFMEGMVKTVGGKIQDKIKSGKINEKDLFNQAQQMMGNVFKNNPMFSAMGGEGLAGMFGGASSNATANAEEDREKRRAELKQKLKENIKNRRHGRK